MRRLGKALGVEAMSLYKHVPNRAAILDGVAETVLAEIEPVPSGGEWREQLRFVAGEFRRVALAHPHVLPLWATRPLASPAGLRPVEQTVAVLRSAGLTDEEAASAFWALLAYMTGALLAEVAWQLGLSETDHAWRHEDLEALDPATFPALSAMGTTMTAAGWETEYERGLELLLAGVTAG